MDIHNLIMDIYKSIMDTHKSIMDIHISINCRGQRSWHQSIIIMDIHKSNYGYP